MFYMYIKALIKYDFVFVVRVRKHDFFVSSSLKLKILGIYLNLNEKREKTCANFHLENKTKNIYIYRFKSYILYKNRRNFIYASYGFVVVFEILKV